MKDYSYDGKHKYQVFVIDYWDNIYETYFVDELKEAEECLNEFFSDCVIDVYDEERAGKTPHFGDGETDYQLYEEAGMFGSSISTINITCEDGDYQVRGFVFK